MAIKVLLGISHTYRHDLESFFYVLIWQCVRRGWEFLNKPMDQSNSKLRAWYTGNYEDIARVKLGDMSKAEDKGFGASTYAAIQPRIDWSLPWVIETLSLTSVMEKVSLLLVNSTPLN